MTYTITDAAAALRAGTVTSVELTQAAIAVADDHDAELGAFIVRYNEQVLDAAAAADAALAAGAEVGPLHGIPLGIKDIITTREGESTAQSLILDRSWGNGDAVVVDRLRAAGGLITGKLTTMEFAIGLPDPTKPFPLPRNPWDTDTWPGGSSSGSGGAVASGMVLGALGTDTGGSIRIPSAYCGITGLMPTFGRVPKSGCVPLGYSLDHIGPMARSAADCALMLSVMAGYHPSDAGAASTPVDDYITGLDGDLTGVRIGVDQLSRYGGAHEDPAMDAAFAAALSALQARGAVLVDVELPYYRELSAACMVIMLSEALAYHAGDLGGRWADYFAATRAIIGTGVFYSAADYVQAQRVRRTGMKAIAELYRRVDLIVTPTCAGPAMRYDELDTLMAERFGSIYTPYWDSAGNPVLALPMGRSAGGLPLSLQISGRPFDEALVLRAGDAYQQETSWHLQVPPLAGKVPASV